jgi:hypothetical protein
MLAWLALAYPVHRLSGREGLLQSSVALGICLVPAAVTLAWAVRARSRPDMQIFVVLGGTGVRMGLVLGCGFLVQTTFPDTFSAAFWIWLLVYYLISLTLEMVALVGTAASGSSQQATKLENRPGGSTPVSVGMGRDDADGQSV